MANETTVVNNIKKALTEKYPFAVVYKIHGSPHQETGIPDLVCCISGRFIALEVKHQKQGESIEHAKGRASVRQVYQIERIRKAGGISEVVLTPEEALEVIAQTLEQGN